MEGINGILHPLQTPIILEKIFKNLKLPDVLVCREVCREWHYSSFKHFCQIAKVRICNDEEKNVKSLSKYLDFILKGYSPQSKLHFPKSVTFVKVDNIDPRFWEYCGPQIETLELDDVKFHFADVFREAIFQRCPNLRKLVIKGMKIISGLDSIPEEPSEWVPPQFPPNLNLRTLSCKFLHSLYSIRAVELISHFPSLENLDIIGTNQDIYSCQLLSALAIARKHDKNCWKMRRISIDLSHVIGKPDLVTFLSGDTPYLEHLITYWEEGREIREIFQNILGAHAGTLKKLEIFSLARDPVDMQNIFKLPSNGTFKALQELRIDAPYLNSTTFPFNAPNLEIFALNVRRFLTEDIPNNMLFQNCVQLLICNEENIKTDDLWKLGRWFPNLEKLRIEYLDNESFSIVCQLWPNLTHLEILKSKLDDSGISGLDGEDVKKINRKGEDGLWKPISVPRANLSSLEYLESLRIHLETSFVPGYCSAAYGLLPLRRLKHLDIQNQEGFQMPKGKMWGRFIPKFKFDPKVFLPLDFYLFSRFN